MRQTELTLLEQLRITDFEIEARKKLFDFTDNDAQALKEIQPIVEPALNRIVSDYYEIQTSIPEIALLIGDADTLTRLQNAQRRYMSGLFSGVYDLEYVNNRLRIGLVHKRIGVGPSLYLSGVHKLEMMLVDLLQNAIDEQTPRRSTIAALQKLIAFDTSLIFETYIRSLLTEIETSKEKSDRYARLLEAKVRDRTRQLEEQTRTDALTGLLNVRHLDEILTRALRAAERRHEPVSLVFADVDNFKTINDAHGHQRGDEVLRAVAIAIRSSSRSEDLCFRYGGDEFCIILPNCRKEHIQDLYVDRVNKALASGISGIKLSFGVADTGPGSYVEAADLLREADANMYRAKNGAKAKTVEMSA